MKINKNKITIFLSDSALEALNKKSEIDETSRSNCAAVIIREALRKENYLPNNN